MFSKLVSIIESEDIQKITQLDKDCLKIILFLIYSDKEEYQYGELEKELRKFGFIISKLSDKLKILAKRELIIHESSRLENGIPQRHKPSKIRLIIENIGQKLELQNQIDKAYNEIQNVKHDSKEMDVKEIFEELKQYSILLASTSLYLKLLLIDKTLTEEMFNIGYLWTSTLYEHIIDLYLKEIENRGKKTITEVLHLYYQT